MLTVFQGETGGMLHIPFTNTIAVSGFVTVVGQHRAYEQITGIVVSGMLSIPKRSFAQFAIGDYMVLPQLVDASGFVYFLSTDTLSVIGRS